MSSKTAADLLRQESPTKSVRPPSFSLPSQKTKAFRYSSGATRSASLPPKASTSASPIPARPAPPRPATEVKAGLEKRAQSVESAVQARPRTVWSPIQNKQRQQHAEGSAAGNGKGKEKAHEAPPDIAKSLLSRLSGPSDGKAGLTRDPEEVKRIIYEASKGSKYFQKQQADDAILTIKVDAMVKKLNTMVENKRGDLRWEERKVDQMIDELEKTRKLQETIVVVDADAFYAACHQREDPSLEGIPFAVGDGVLTTASYAARAYGCRSAMAGFVAKKLCPHLKFIDLDFELYTTCSRDIMGVLAEFGVISPASLDEAYCSLTDYVRREGCTPAEAGERMRAAVFAKTGLTVSAGVTPNAMMSKIAADMNKPNGQFVVDPSREASMAFMKDLPIRKVPGIGRVSERVMQAVGIQKVGDIFALRGKLFLIQKEIGLTFLLRTLLGLGTTSIIPAERGERKTYGREDTFGDLSDMAELSKKLRKLSNQVAEDLRAAQFSGRTITLKVKYHDYKTLTRAKTLGGNIFFSDAATIYSEASKLLAKEVSDYKKKAREKSGNKCKPFTLRLLGVRMSNLRDEMPGKSGASKTALSDWTSHKETEAPVSSSKINKARQVKSESPQPRFKAEPIMRTIEEVDDDDIIIIDSFDDDFQERKPEVSPELKPTLPLDQNLSLSTQPKPPASSDPLWAEFDGEEGGDEYLADIDLELEAQEGLYKPFWKAGEGMNSKLEMEMPVPVEDRLSFGGGGGEGKEEDGLTCPVCEKVFQGSEAGLSAHVATHFEDDIVIVERPKKKQRTTTSPSSSDVPHRPKKKGTKKGGKNTGGKIGSSSSSGDLLSFFKKR